MSTTTTTRTEEFGRCTKKDLAGLDAAVERFQKANTEAAAARQALGKVMKRLIEKGAQKRALQRRAGFPSWQTVSNIAYGRQDSPNGQT